MPTKTLQSYYYHCKCSHVQKATMWSDNMVSVKCVKCGSEMQQKQENKSFIGIISEDYGRKK